jgi:membrane protease YdiL (CAAX protease family)
MLKGFSKTKPEAGLEKKSSKKLVGNFGSPWRVIGTTLLIFIVSQVLAAFLVEVVLGIAHSGTNPNGSLDQSAPAQFFYVGLAEGGAIWLVLKVVKNRGLKLANIGLSRRPAGMDIVKGLLGFAAFFALLIVVNGLLAFIFPNINSETQDVGFNTLNNSLDQTLALIALVIFPPLGEETLVRGYLYSGLRSKWKFLPALLVTSLLFGLAHLQLGSGADVLWAAGVDTFTLSVVLVYLRETTGALYAGMLVHSLNNLIAFGVHFH